MKNTKWILLVLVFMLSAALLLVCKVLDSRPAAVEESRPVRETTAALTEPTVPQTTAATEDRQEPLTIPTEASEATSAPTAEPTVPKTEPASRPGTGTSSGSTSKPTTPAPTQPPATQPPAPSAPSSGREDELPLTPIV